MNEVVVVAIITGAVGVLTSFFGQYSAQKAFEHRLKKAEEEIKCLNKLEPRVAVVERGLERMHEDIKEIKGKVFSK